MFDFTHDPNATATTPHHPLHSFADEHRDALLDAAALLGGPDGARLAQSVLDGLADQARPSRRLMRAVGNLLGLLTLEQVHDMSREEAARFAAIDPADPCVEEICLLADGLTAAIEESEAQEDEEPSPSRGGIVV